MQTQDRIIKLFGPEGFNTWRYKPASVSVSFRVGSKHRPKLCISLNTRAMQKLGWVNKDRISVQMDYESNRIVMVRNPQGLGYVRGRLGYGIIEMAVPGINPTTRREAKPSGFKVKDGDVLVVEMPTWLAQPKKTAVAPAPTPAPEPVRAPVKKQAVPYVGVMGRVIDPAAALRGRGR